MSIRLRTFSCILLSSFLWAQDIAWQQTLGGAREEHLYEVIFQTCWWIFLMCLNY